MTLIMHFHPKSTAILKVDLILIHIISLSEDIAMCNMPYFQAPLEWGGATRLQGARKRWSSVVFEGIVMRARCKCMLVFL